MTYHLRFTLPYILNIALLIYSGWVLQDEHLKTKLVVQNQCVAEKSMYSIITTGLRRRAAVEASIELPPVEGDAERKRSDALLLEAREMENAGLRLPNCRV